MIKSERVSVLKDAVCPPYLNGGHFYSPWQEQLQRLRTATKQILWFYYHLYCSAPYMSITTAKPLKYHFQLLNWHTEPLRTHWGQPWLPAHPVPSSSSSSLWKTTGPDCCNTVALTVNCCFVSFSNIKARINTVFISSPLFWNERDFEYPRDEVDLFYLFSAATVLSSVEVFGADLCCKRSALSRPDLYETKLLVTLNSHNCPWKTKRADFSTYFINTGISLVKKRTIQFSFPGSSMTKYYYFWKIQWRWFCIYSLSQ